MSQFVMVPVKLLDKSCLDCSNLELEDDLITFYSLDDDKRSEHCFQCKNLSHCSRAYEKGLKEASHQEHALK